MISRSLLQSPALPTELSGVCDPRCGPSSPGIIPSASPQVSYLEYDRFLLAPPFFLVALTPPIEKGE
jgi:hypothetical protein